MVLFSPLRAVMFWPAREERPELHPLVRKGMWEYVYRPLGLPMQTNPARYRDEALMMYNYTALIGLIFEKDIVAAVLEGAANHAAIAPTTQKKAPKAVTASLVLKWTSSNNCCDDYVVKHKRYIPKKLPTQPSTEGCNTAGVPDRSPAAAHWKAVSRYYGAHVERLATDKSVKASRNVTDCDSYEAITPLPVIDMRDLLYSRESIRFLHGVCFEQFFNNPMYLLRRLTQFMKESLQVSSTNLNACSMLHSLAKSCKKSMTVRLTLLTEKIPAMTGLCFGEKNRNVKRVLGLYTVRMCPWCYKPVNVAVKKKSSAGGAHKSQIFTDEHTREVTYCTEKNTRGILDFPLLAIRDGQLYSNELAWEINSGFTRVFSLCHSEQDVCRMVIRNAAKTCVYYVPVETTRTCPLNTKYPCMLCSRRPGRQHTHP